MVNTRNLIIAVVIIFGFASRAWGATSSEEFDAIMYGSESYTPWRQITYWGRASVSVRDYEYGLGDSEFLKLIVKDKTKPYPSDRPRDDIERHFLTEFRRLFGDLPFNDLEKDRDKRLVQFRGDNPQWDFIKNPSVDVRESYDAFNAAELARRNALYGGHAGAIYCNIVLKRRTFPVLYEIRCSIGSGDDLSYDRWSEQKDIGFGTPEYIDKEIKQAITRTLEKINPAFRKAKKYPARKSSG